MFDLDSYAGKEALSWYAIFNGTTDYSALADFYQLGGKDAYGIWLGTQYEDWTLVMPYIAPVDPDGEFIHWVAEKAEKDWGMLVGTTSTFQQLLAHFRSLTQIWMPSGTHAFFRFYDPRFSLNVAKFCDKEQRAKVMGPCQVWLSQHGDVVNVTPTVGTIEPEFPWWTVPEDVLLQLSNIDNSTLIANSIKWLKESHADIYFFFPESTVIAKVTRLVNRHKKEFGSLNEYIKSVLEKEVYR
ncbi:hypothetical protein CW749_01855 [Vibrio sp. vnigr-6D03]|uniref:DUF4123 domain-containing protein n=1 Tax=Vibrio sp. vnigr-6D03 TaxID=2058088 RepID=UPI000C33D72A|nr:DUF4123 domain-containing protein [Vibrio sp. vnigr-6D03]PKF81410.1 hypothetical protein CW749_01855 [Vibrio sp. vnigr-6D03]